jgi:glutamate synthase (NADPH) small chain
MPKANFERVPMKEQDAKIRARNFEEVALGYDEQEAIAEAERCLQCKNRPCIEGCPVNVDIPDFIKALREGDLQKSADILTSKNNLPAICGRVCPQETQCESRCLVGKKGTPLAVGRLERFVADWRLQQGAKVPEMPQSSGKKVAVVGAGPAGLTCAADLARAGHKVTMFESLHAAGGVLMYGIPPFRLPDAVIEAEVEYVRSLGVDIRLNHVIGKLFTVDELLDGEYDAVFLGTGAGLPTFMNVPGENLNGVYSANEFLSRVVLMQAYKFPEVATPVIIGKKVAVIGAGNVAMDSARCAMRLGADEVYIVYRRSAAEVPARAEEVHHAKEEGIVFKLLSAPTRYNGDERGWLKSMEVQEMELGEPDASGRRRPVPIVGSEYTMDVDVAVVAIGTSPNPLIARTTENLETSKHGTVVTDEENGRTKKARVWAGGDVVTGAATVISAMGAGKRAAADIDAYLKSI